MRALAEWHSHGALPARICTQACDIANMLDALDAYCVSRDAEMHAGPGRRRTRVSNDLEAAPGAASPPRGWMNTAVPHN